MTAPFRWFPHEGGRHAVSNTLRPSSEGRTLCGIAVVAPVGQLPAHPDWLWPECELCNGAWRKAEGLPPRPDPVPLPRSNGRVRRAEITSKSGARS